jgi:hypothetical protein
MVANPEPLPAFDCTVIVLRVLMNSKQMKELSEAFFLRADELDSGLSVNWNMSPEKARDQFEKCYGTVSLHVGRVRTLDLDVIPDEPTHANVTGLPYKENDPKAAERLANLLAQQARAAGELRLYKRIKNADK